MTFKVLPLLTARSGFLARTGSRRTGSRRTGSRRTGAVIATLAGTAAVGIVSAATLPPAMAAAATLTAGCIALWATALVPEYWTALAFVLLAVVLRLAPPQTVFSGFSSSTFWLLFGGLILGSAIRHTGLGKRGAAVLAPLLGKRYRSIVAGLVLYGVGMAFVLPSAVGRIILMVPIVIALADHLGYAPGSKGRQGMVLAIAFGTTLPAFTILPANVPNMMLAGMAETLFGLHLSYGDYLLLHFPVLGLLKAGVLIAVILRLFPDRDPARSAKEATDPMPPVGAGEVRLIGVLGLSLALWLTDGLHHIAPGWIGLGAALVCLWPSSGLTAKTCLKDDVNLGLLLFLGGMMAMGAVISVTGLGETAVDALTRHADFATDRPVWNVVALAVMSSIVAVVTNLPGVPAVMTPIAEHMAHLTALPLTTVLMTQVLAFSNIFLPYQSPPLITAMSVGGLSLGVVSRICLILFAVSLLVLTPLDLLWWHLLGAL